MPAMKHADSREPKHKLIEFGHNTMGYMKAFMDITHTDWCYKKGAPQIDRDEQGRDPVRTLNALGRLISGVLTSDIRGMNGGQVLDLVVSDLRRHGPRLQPEGNLYHALCDYHQRKNDARSVEDYLEMGKSALRHLTQPDLPTKLNHEMPDFNRDQWIADNAVARLVYAIAKFDPGPPILEKVIDRFIRGAIRPILAEIRPMELGEGAA